MGPPLQRTCLPVCWTTAAVATCPPCGAWAEGGSLGLMSSRRNDWSQPPLYVIQVLKQTGILGFCYCCLESTPRLTILDPSITSENTTITTVFLPSPIPFLSVHVRWDGLISLTLTRTGGRFKSNCEGLWDESVLGKGRKCWEEESVGLVGFGVPFLLWEGDTTDWGHCFKVQVYHRYVAGVVIFLGMQRTSVVAGARGFLGCPACRLKKCISCSRWWKPAICCHGMPWRYGCEPPDTG